VDLGALDRLLEQVPEVLYAHLWGARDLLLALMVDLASRLFQADVTGGWVGAPSPVRLLQRRSPWDILELVSTHSHSRSMRRLTLSHRVWGTALRSCSPRCEPVLLGVKLHEPLVEPFPRVAFGRDKNNRAELRIACIDAQTEVWRLVGPDREIGPSLNRTGVRSHEARDPPVASRKSVFDFVQRQPVPVAYGVSLCNHRVRPRIDKLVGLEVPSKRVASA